MGQGWLRAIRSIRRKDGVLIMKPIPVKHWFSEPGLDREYYKHAETGKKYCLQDSGWFTVSGELLEPEYFVNATFVDSKTGKEITEDEQP